MDLLRLRSSGHARGPWRVKQTRRKAPKRVTQRRLRYVADHSLQAACRLKSLKFQALPLQYDVRFPTLVAKQTPPDSPSEAVFSVSAAKNGCPACVDPFERVHLADLSMGSS